MDYNCKIVFSASYSQDAELLRIGEHARMCEVTRKKALKNYSAQTRAASMFGETLEPFQEIMNDTEYFVLPSYVIEKGGLQVKSEKIARIFAAEPTKIYLFYSLCVTKNNNMFEFFLVKNKEVISSFRCCNGRITRQVSLERIDEVLSITSRCKKLDEILTDKVEALSAASCLENYLSIPIIITEDTVKNYFVKVDKRIYHSVFQSRDSYKDKYKFAFPCSDDYVQLTVNRSVIEGNSAMSIHLFKSDLPEDFINKILQPWCQKYAQDSMVFVDHDYISIWNDEWDGGDVQEIATQLSQEFRCHVLGVFLFEEQFLTICFAHKGCVGACISWDGECNAYDISSATKIVDGGLEVSCLPEPQLDAIEAANKLANSLGIFITEPVIDTSIKKVADFTAATAYSFH